MIKKNLILSLLTAGLVSYQANASSTNEVDIFIAEMADRHSFSLEKLQQKLKQAEKNQDILNAIARPWEAKPWHQYRPIFITGKRIEQGVNFWNDYKPWLEKAEREYGVPAEIIVAIIGVETFYGRYKGKYPVLDALYTLGFHYPPRQKFFRSELEHFLLLSREENWKPAEPKGSYAGAMGLGQFISSSYRHYAVDFDGDNKRDLFSNPADAIGSVANYFAKHKWKPGKPVAYPVTLDGEGYKSLLNDKLKPNVSKEQLVENGVKLPSDAQIEGPVKLVELEQQQSEEYWVGLHNFYVITRYNHSQLYAMAVYQLSEDIKRAKGDEPA